MTQNEEPSASLFVFLLHTEEKKNTLFCFRINKDWSGNCKHKDNPNVPKNKYNFEIKYWFDLCRA